MSKNQIKFEGDDTAALEYIWSRQYVSYSSAVNVRDRKEPGTYIETPALRFGKELHSRFLEGKKLETLTKEEEKLLKAMVKSLRSDIKVRMIMKEAQCEIDFDQYLLGVRVYGRIDILTFAVADLKTTRHKTKKSFVESMDFLQAALYMRVSGRKDFYYIGISKEKPHPVMVFSVLEFPAKLKRANQELDFLLRYIKKKLWTRQGKK